MNCARCLLRLQSVGIVSLRHASLINPNRASASALAKALQLLRKDGQLLRRFHGSPACAKNQTVPTQFGGGEEEEEGDDGKKKDRSLVAHDNIFERVAKDVKTKANFNKVVDVFLKKDIRRRGHVEFIYAALSKMPDFGVERDLAVYNKLLDVFPKEVFVPRNFIQRMFNHYPRQQECAIQLLEQMENYGIMPNVETKVLLAQIFGVKGHPYRKYQRIMYWFPKFKHTNPYPVPHQLPEDPVDLARLSLTRIANDLDAKVTVYQLPCTDITESGEEVTLPHIVGSQSPDQMELLAKHNPNRPLFVEGPFPLWLRKTCVYYYILRADPLPPEEKVEVPYDPERCFDYPLQLDLDLDRDLGDEETFDVEDLDEGAVFAMCMTSQGDQSTLNQWITGLQGTNPILGRVPTLFRLESGPRELQGVADPNAGHGYQPEAETVAQSGEERTQPEALPDITIEEEPPRSQGLKQ